MNLLEWFICWVGDNQKTFSPKELAELDILIKRIKIELLDSFGSKDYSTRSKKQRQRNSECSQSFDENTSCPDLLNEGSMNRNDEMETNVTTFEAHDVFLSLVKVYLKDAKQINLSYQSATTESSFLSEEELPVDYGSDDENCSVCDNQMTDLNLDSKSCSFTAREKNCDELDCSTETSSCSNSDTASSDGKLTNPSVIVESFKTLRHIRQDLKELASNLLKLDKNADFNAIKHFNEALSNNRLKLDTIESNGNERMNTVRETLIKHIQKLVVRLKTLNLPSSFASNEQTRDSQEPISCPLERIENVQKLAECVREDMKLSLFDSRTDKDFVIFDEKLTNYLIQLDGVQCKHDESLLAARKKVVKYIEELICRLEVKLSIDVFLTNDIEDPSSSVTLSETLQRIESVESLVKNMEYLTNSFGLDVDDNFSVNFMLSKCLAQLNCIECHDDEQLLKRRQKVVDYVGKLMKNVESASSSDVSSEKSCDEQVSDSSATLSEGLEKIRKVERESERLNVHIVFGYFQSRTDRIYMYVEEMLTKLLISLDSICCDGNDEMRAARKKAVLYINQLTENLEAKVPS